MWAFSFRLRSLSPEGFVGLDNWKEGTFLAGNYSNDENEWIDITSIGWMMDGWYISIWDS